MINKYIIETDRIANCCQSSRKIVFLLCMMLMKIFGFKQKLILFDKYKENN